MKKYAILIITLCLGQLFQAQNDQEHRIIRSNLGSSGSSKTVTTIKGVFTISQSIGQSSVIGTHYSNGYYVRQGYQQPFYKQKTVKNLGNDLTVKVFPNPFIQDITITFSHTIKKEIVIIIYDINGKNLYTQEFLPAQEIKVNLTDISSGMYILKVVSEKLFFNTKLIKI